MMLHTPRMEWLLLLLIALPQIPLTTGQAPFDGCDVTDYYPFSSSSPPRRSELHTLLARTHRRRLPYTDNDADDVWKALLDIDAGGDGTDTVQLIYTQTLQRNASTLRGVAGGWNREHLWPQSRGGGTSGDGAAFTDVHHLRPSDWNVNAARGNKFLAACPMTIDNTGAEIVCTIPAHVEAAADTAASPTTFLPPTAVRGVVARALLYMSVRYADAISLTDCPTNNVESEMAYLSELITWHQLYPVTADEEQRNQRICERWQGNRNPFVDHPTWVTALFPSPQTRQPYNCSSTTPATPDVTTPPAINSSSCPSPGSIMIIGANTDNPDAVAMVALTTLPPGLKLYLTDNAWSNSNDQFRTNEGVLTAVLSQNISAGTVFGPGMEPSSTFWESSSGSFALSAAGDTLLLYCLDDNDNDTPIHHITGLSLAGPWIEEDGTDTSALPDALMQTQDLVVTLPTHVDNAQYVGSTVGTARFLQSQITQSENWQTSNSERFEFTAESWQFQITSCAKSLSTLCLTSSLVLYSLFVWHG